jgi:hypothetical protein
MSGSLFLLALQSPNKSFIWILDATGTGNFESS